MAAQGESGVVKYTEIWNMVSRGVRTKKEDTVHCAWCMASVDRVRNPCSHVAVMLQVCCRCAIVAVMHSRETRRDPD